MKAKSKQNAYKRTLFITDIHGHYTNAMNLLKSVNYNEKEDLLILGGDYFDRGPENDLVAAWLSKIYKDDNVVLLKGNHDYYLEMLLKYDWLQDTLDELGEHRYRDEAYRINHMIAMNGGAKTIDQLTKAPFAPTLAEASKAINENYPELLNVLKSLRNYYETESEIFTHASLMTDFRDPNKSDWEDDHWKKPTHYIPLMELQDKKVYVGHESLAFNENWNGKDPLVIKNVILCDGGMGAGLRGLIVEIKNT